MTWFLIVFVAIGSAVIGTLIGYKRCYNEITNIMNQMSVIVKQGYDVEFKQTPQDDETN